VSKWTSWILALLLAPQLASAQIGGCVPDESDPVVVAVDTPLGSLDIALFPNTAPTTVQNFLDYMNAGDYDGALFHRSVPGFVIQAGGFTEVAGSYAVIPTAPPIPNEPCLSNTRGTVAMARLGGQPNSATSQWFVNLADNLFLDSADGVGFTAFGRVLPHSLPVADAIAALPVYDALAILELPFNQIFRELPLQALPVDPGTWGCARELPTFGLADPLVDLFVADPLRSGSAVVPVLLDPQCTGAGAVGPPSVPCTVGVGRDVFEIDLPDQVFFQPRIAMTCDAVAESEDSWQLRRDGTTPQLMVEDVEITMVPEPAVGATRFGLLLLLLLGRLRRCAPPVPVTG